MTPDQLQQQLASFEGIIIGLQAGELVLTIGVVFLLIKMNGRLFYKPGKEKS